MPSSLDAALRHAAAGRPIFPCGLDKRPLTPRGFYDATTDPGAIRQWWGRWPTAMIGMPTGEPAGVFVIDVDVDPARGKDGEAALADLVRRHGPLPDTVEAMTPRGGRHLYFRHPRDGARIPCSAGKLADSIDVRGDGGYVILPPSTMPGGRGYCWEGSSDPDEGVRAAAPPDWLLALVVAPAETAPAAPLADEDAAAIEAGARNDTLFRLGRSLRAKGLSAAAILAALQAENGARCNPPLDDAEVRQIASSAATKAPGRSPDYETRVQTPPAAEPEAPAPAGDADDDLARAFVDAHPLLRYVPPWGKWLAFDGVAWLEDSTLGVFSAVRESLRTVADDNPKRRRDLLAAKTVAAVERLARSDPRAVATPPQFDADDWVLNTPAGAFDLRGGGLRPHSPKDYCTKRTAAGPAGDCPRWRQFLREITAEDEGLVAFLQRVAGYAATGSIREHALFFCYGTGANGKGTILNTLTRLLKDYATVAPMEVFTESHTDRHPTELAMLRVVRLVVSQETEEGRRWAESRIKALTGGDPITARYMRQDFFTFEPKFKLLIAGNHKPKLRNVDEAMRRRLHLIPFTVTVPPKQRDPDLAQTLEREAPGIMAWVVEGAAEYLRVGLAPPAVVRDATAEYFGEEDIFSQWLEDECERGAGDWATASRLFAAWRRYAEQANTRAGDQRSFAGRMEAAGFARGNSRTKGGRHWLGLRLVQPDLGEELPEWAA